MPEQPEPRPALAFLKRNAAVLGLVVLVAGGAGAVAITQATGSKTPTALATPVPVATVGLGQQAPASPGSTAPGQPAGATGTGPTRNASGSTPPAPLSGAQAPTATATPSPTPHVIGTEPQAPTEQDFHKNAEAFATAWINTDGGKDAWLARLKPLITPSLYQSFTHTDISRIPAGTYTGVALDEKFPGNIRFTGMYSGSKALYKAIDQLQPDGTWLVSQLGSPN